MDDIKKENGQIDQESSEPDNKGDRSIFGFKPRTIGDLGRYSPISKGNVQNVESRIISKDGCISAEDVMPILQLAGLRPEDIAVLIVNQALIAYASGFYSPVTIDDINRNVGTGLGDFIENCEFAIQSLGEFLKTVIEEEPRWKEDIQGLIDRNPKLINWFLQDANKAKIKNNAKGIIQDHVRKKVHDNVFRSWSDVFNDETIRSLMRYYNIGRDTVRRYCSGFLPPQKRGPKQKKK